MTSCIVTCIYDLKKRSPDYFHRAGEEYACMLEYHRRFNVPVYCYTEEHIVHMLPDFIIPIVIPLDELPSKQLIRTTGKGYEHVMVGNTVHDGHVLYSIVTNSKIFFMSMIPEEYDTYVWLDSGIEHADPAPEHVALETYNDTVNNPKSRINLINYPTHIELDKNMYNVASGMFSIKKKDMSLLLESYREILKQCYNMGYICLEEQIFTMLYLKHKENIFSTSFTDYRLLSNGKYYRMDHAVILRNIYNCPRDIGRRIVDIFLDTLATGNTKLSPDDMMNYFVQIYNALEDIRVGRIFKHLLMFKIYVNNPKYKGRYNVVSKLIEYGLGLDKLEHIEACSSMHEYYKMYPYERSIISTIV